MSQIRRNSMSLMMDPTLARQLEHVTDADLDRVLRLFPFLTKAEMKQC